MKTRTNLRAGQAAMNIDEGENPGNTGAAPYDPNTP